MVLGVPGALFNRANRPAAEARTATIIVAKDGSGDTDDIQEAIEMLPAGGGTVSVKEGTFEITAAIDLKQSNTALVGTGFGTVITTTADIYMITATNLNRLIISNLRLIGTKTNAANRGVHLTNCDHCTISGCAMENTGDSSIDIRGGSEFTIITQNHISNSGGHGIRLVPARETVVSNNVVETCTEEGIECNGYGNNTVIGNISRNNVKHGILVTSEVLSVIIGNICYGNDTPGQTQTYAGIKLLSADDCIVSSNNCTNNDGYEIDIGAGCDRTVVIGNQTWGADNLGAINDAGTNTLPNGAYGTNNLELDDLNHVG